MNRYAVEIMSGQTSTSIAYATTSTPKAAAEWVTGRDVQDWRDDHQWVRVTDQANRTVYKFAFK
jgi:hypothetical protein